jgi:hypothetical protein
MKMHRVGYLLAAAISVNSGVATAASDIDQLQNLAQDQFRLLSEDMGAAFSYKAMAPAAPLGITGFDVGVVVSATSLENEAALEAATSGDAPSVLPMPRLHVLKGLPWNIDIGGTYVSVPGTDIKLWGAELRWALLEGGVATPAVGLRGSMTRLDGVNQLDFDTKAIDISVSKGFVFATPYAGVGQVWVSSTPKNIPLNPISEETFSMTKMFAGVSMKFLLVNMVFEVDKTGDATTYGAKFGLKF